MLPHGALRFAQHREQLVCLANVPSVSIAPANERNLQPDMLTALGDMPIRLRQMHQLDIAIRHDRLTQQAGGVLVWRELDPLWLGAPVWRWCWPEVDGSQREACLLKRA